MSQIRRLAPALVATVAVALSGCSSDEPAPSPPTTTPAPTTTTPAPSAAPTAPAMPPAATRPNKTGARAFVAYYWDLISYAQITGDLDELTDASGPNCGGCSGGRDRIKRVYDSGGHITDGEYVETIKSLKRLAISSDRDVEAFEAKVKVTNGQHVEVGADGVEVPYPAGTTTYAMYLIWNKGWRLDVMELI